MVGLPFPGFGLHSLASQMSSLYLDWGLNQSMGQGSCLLFCWNLYQKGRDTCLQGCGRGSEKRTVQGLGSQVFFSRSATPSYESDLGEY